MHAIWTLMCLYRLVKWFRTVSSLLKAFARLSGFLDFCCKGYNIPSYRMKVKHALGLSQQGLRYRTAFITLTLADSSILGRAKSEGSRFVPVYHTIALWTILWIWITLRHIGLHVFLRYVYTLYREWSRATKLLK